MIAGSDTAAKAIKNVVVGVVSNPKVYQALFVEIEHAIAEGRVSEPITDQEARNLPYLQVRLTALLRQVQEFGMNQMLNYLLRTQAVILEGLRIGPPFPGLIMKETGPEGDLYKGCFIPPGTRIAHDTWSVTHSQAIFGPDADHYRPERWLEATEDERGVMKRQTELVFGSGRWACAGKAVASLELNKIFVEVRLQ